MKKDSFSELLTESFLCFLFLSLSSCSGVSLVVIEDIDSRDINATKDLDITHQSIGLRILFPKNAFVRAQSCPTLCDPTDVAHQAPLSM